MKNILLGLALSIFTTASVFAADGIISTSATSPRPNLITVSGTGTLEVAPEIAMIDLTITTRSNVSRDAQNENAVLTAQLTKALNEKYRSGIISIKTTSFTVQPEVNPEDPRTITGYVVRHALQVRFNFVEGLGEALDVAIANGATTIDFIQFGLKDEKKYSLQSLKVAMNDASSKASAIAGSVGRKLIRVVKVVEGQYMVGSQKDAAQDREGGTEIYPRMVSVTSNLTVTYEF